jgi:hypothetical protein
MSVGILILGSLDVEKVDAVRNKQISSQLCLAPFDVGVTAVNFAVKGIIVAGKIVEIARLFRESSGAHTHYWLDGRPSISEQQR